MDEKLRRIAALRELSKRDGRDRAMVHERAIEIYEFIFDFIIERGYAPTFRQIGQACGVSSTSLISLYLGQLERAGVITREPGISRSILLVQQQEVVADGAI
jgi:repressor LexA